MEHSPRTLQQSAALTTTGRPSLVYVEASSFKEPASECFACCTTSAEDGHLFQEKHAADVFMRSHSTTALHKPAHHVIVPFVTT